MTSNTDDIGSGGLREFYVGLPPSYDSSNTYPVVIVFPGYSQTGEDYEYLREQTNAQNVVI